MSHHLGLTESLGSILATKSWPSSSTCRLQLTLPLSHQKYEDFKEAMMQDLMVLENLN